MGAAIMIRNVILSLAALAILSCSGAPPTGPDPVEETASIPWSLISGKIAFSRTISEGLVRSSSLFVIDGDSRTMTLVKEGDEFWDLAWKYDGTKITFVRSESWWRPYSINPDGSDESLIYTAHGHHAFPAWSRDGRLAYWFNGDHALCGVGKCGYSIFIDDAPFLTAPRCDRSRPAWSPDSRFLVVSMTDATSQGSLYQVSLTDTTTAPLLLGQGTWNAEIFTSPIYSPDGHEIAFAKGGEAVHPHSEIWIMNADGTNPTRLTSGYGDGAPAWSPDGDKIAFVRHRERLGNQIFLMDSDGGGLTQVTQNGGESPTWIP